MEPSQLRARVLLERLAGIRSMLANIRALPLDSYDSFCADPRTPAAAESYVRRALEMLLDLGRHLLAKGFARSALEYKAIARELEAVGVLSAEEGRLLREMAGYCARWPATVTAWSISMTKSPQRSCTKFAPKIWGISSSWRNPLNAGSAITRTGLTRQSSYDRE